MNLSDVKEMFPYFKNNEYIYLDSAASNLKLQSVINSESNYLSNNGANIHRGVYQNSMLATTDYESTRTLVAEYIGAKFKEEIVFTSGTTESINLLAFTVSKICQNRKEIMISQLEHHSNIVPWQLLAQREDFSIKVIPIDSDGNLDIKFLENNISVNTALIAVSHVSNVLGGVNPVEKIIQIAHKSGALVVIDGAQAIAHVEVNVTKLDADFYVFSAHKMYGPNGVGILWGRKELLNKMPPWKGGGDMISTVTFKKSTWADLPHKFEAGTPNISGVIAFAESIKFMKEIGIANIIRHELELKNYLRLELSKIGSVNILGNAKEQIGVVSFLVTGIHPHDIGTYLDQHKIAVRTGHHCCQPIMDYFQIAGTTRASIGIYNSRDDIDQLVSALKKLGEIFR